MIKISKRHWEINNNSKTVRAYWKSKTLLVPFKITERSYQINHTRCYPTITMGWTLFKIVSSENERKDDQEHFPYNGADLDSPFTNEEILKSTTLLKSKKASGHDSISNEVIKASLPSSSSFLVTQ